MTADKSESVLSRWSRRKLEAERKGVADTGVNSEDPPVEETPESAAPVVSEAPPPLTDADMPDLESLTEDSDFSPFMSAGVSDELRNLALRKLFRAPVFNIRDGLDEYDDDFTQFEKLGDIVTSDMKHRIEMEQQKLREQLAEQGDADEIAQTQDVEADEEDEFDEEADEIEVAATTQSREQAGND